MNKKVLRLNVDIHKGRARPRMDCVNSDMTADIRNY